MVTPKEQPAAAQASIPVSVSLKDIYDALCPACQQALLDLISGKASAGLVREGLRKQLEAPAHGEPVEPSPDVDS